ncbi:hypothetical protein RJ641_012875 [Dillenia turbinata]|uniref:Uncharacterized protein n=1 Tax=Dillenia turbinata TaxID=194707 RepID=A0AAN8Z6I2_9MAGN
METFTQYSPILPLALVYFIIVYFVGYLGFLRNWSPRTRAEASSSFMSLAEITSGCQNVWSLSRIRKAEAATAAAIYDFLSPFFYTYYSVVRGD